MVDPKEEDLFLATLVDCIGLEGAFHPCQVSSWNGVMGFIFPEGSAKGT